MNPRIHAVVIRAGKRLLCGSQLASTLFFAASLSNASAVGPYAITQAPTQPSADMAILRGVVQANGVPTAAWFEWGLNGGSVTATAITNVGIGENVVWITAPITNLQPYRIYHFSLVASNELGVTRGANQIVG